MSLRVRVLVPVLVLAAAATAVHAGRSPKSRRTTQAFRKLAGHHATASSTTPLRRVTLDRVASVGRLPRFQLRGASSIASALGDLHATAIAAGGTIEVLDGGLLFVVDRTTTIDELNRQLAQQQAAAGQLYAP
jgi:hypothetical protein